MPQITRCLRSLSTIFAKTLSLAARMIQNSDYHPRRSARAIRNSGQGTMLARESSTLVRTRVHVGLIAA